MAYELLSQSRKLNKCVGGGGGGGGRGWKMFEKNKRRAHLLGTRDYISQTKKLSQF